MTDCAIEVNVHVVAKLDLIGEDAHTRDNNASSERHKRSQYGCRVNDVAKFQTSSDGFLDQLAPDNWITDTTYHPNVSFIPCVKPVKAAQHGIAVERPSPMIRILINETKNFVLGRDRIPSHEYIEYLTSKS